MNERYNRIAGCQMAVDAARAQCDIAARRLADGFMACEDEGGECLPDSRDYRAAQEAYADTLDQLADALRR
jgi:hypothetical protein